MKTQKKQLPAGLLLKVLESAASLSDGLLLWKILSDEDERRWRLTSKTITQDEWLAKIKQISDPITRIQTACIVWWDYVDVWPKFDKYLSAWKPDQHADKEQTRKALMNLGYPERLATERVKTIK